MAMRFYAQCNSSALIANIFFKAFIRAILIVMHRSRWDANWRPRIRERDVGWHLAERVGWLREEAVTRLSVRDAWPRTRRRALTCLSPLISGLVYLNRSLGSSPTANPMEDEEARERRASCYVFTCSWREITAILLSFSLNWNKSSTKIEREIKEEDRERCGPLLCDSLCAPFAFICVHCFALAHVIINISLILVSMTLMDDANIISRSEENNRGSFINKREELSTWRRLTVPNIPVCASN